MNPPPVKPAARATQRRGDARREQLLHAAHALLEKQDFRELTFVAVCERAGIPHGSARFFYPDLDALLRGLLGELGKRHDEELARPLPRSATRSWQAIVHCMIDRSARFHRRNPVFAKLTIGGHMPPELKRLDRDADLDRARWLLRRLDEHFVLPKHRDILRLMYFATEVTDTAFMLSMRESNQVTAWWVRQAKRGSSALMEPVFGELSPRRSGSR